MFMPVLATEIRIGNLLMVPLNDNSYIEVMEIYRSEMKVRHVNGSDTYVTKFRSNLHLAIPISNIVLKKCGFEFLHLNARNERFYVNIQTYYPFQIRMESDKAIFHESSQLQLRLLHQLQNLFFSITGEEIDIAL